MLLWLKFILYIDKLEVIHVYVINKQGQIVDKNSTYMLWLYKAQKIKLLRKMGVFLKAERLDSFPWFQNT